MCSSIFINEFYFIFLSESCITVGGPASGLPCIFPFKFNGITHNNCTMNKAHLTNNKGWCSTKVDASGQHIGAQGNWGNCDCKVESEMAFYQSTLECLE